MLIVLFYAFFKMLLYVVDWIVDIIKILHLRTFCMYAVFITYLNNRGKLFEPFYTVSNVLGIVVLLLSLVMTAFSVANMIKKKK